MRPRLLDLFCRSVRHWLVGVLLNVAGRVAREDNFTLMLALAWNAYRNPGPEVSE